VPFDPNRVEFQFKRNFPLNLSDEAATTVQLKGMVSEETRLGLLSFVPNPETELKAMQKDTEAQIDLDKVRIDTLQQGQPDQQGPPGN
jgi:hypothetical protein